MIERDYRYLMALQQISTELSKIREVLDKLSPPAKPSRELPDLETFFEEMEDDGK